MRVFDVTRKSDCLVKQLKGHSLRVFNTAWSPLLPNMVASGSDDRAVRVWDIESERSYELTGHTENVRALVWHTEIPYIILSGIIITLL